MTKPDLNFPSSLLSALREARRVVALTGAGISAESGVPTFRDAQTGLWAKFKPEELATPEAFRRNPRLVWEWYEWRRQLVGGVQPNPGHLALAEIERRVPEFLLITQNVDGLHQRAGSRRVIELHGNLTRTKCFEENVALENVSATKEVPPLCPRCGGHARPDVVWFGDPLPPGAFEAALAASLACEVFFSIGTSSVVYPAADLPCAALRNRAVLVEINPAPTPLTPDATHSFQQAAGVVLPALVQAAWPK
jgi:NAD-dependent deacetylase